ncbi:hypothetical protein EYZ11_013407 [Aspergillus tanneri]|uniref:Uncharacterized protein n=1 Tax=Aspergillus tanneri TaxID=1220188 RepID=A0A4S3IZY0_9EURO|nr:hypothetical protein EYZ11_013407 [Aspergillus tanneri]
MHRPVVVIAI